ncbi:MAG: GNAT family N-acetyltransferase [Anaerolineae bacterium]|nr:GNAT family N-acetyltransferase [Anaerolineae bacterium]MCB0212499.1 GNAT family N-acetyltransferase [Anaerolineae bacterium]MCB0222984.1 GNAT family N-acetyltransferase [Anaerolineae bacterium]
MSKQITLGCTYYWWQGDPLPELPPLPDFAARIVTDKGLLAQLHDMDEAAIQARFDEGAHCYVPFLDDTPVGYGWVGTRVGHIREVGLEWALGELDCALWDFAVLPAYRGRGVYPHLLQAIIRTESAPTERFWIGHQGQNIASQRGIQKAGFILNNRTLLTSDGQIILQPHGDLDRVMADPMRSTAQAYSQNMPEAVRQELIQAFAHLF